MKNLIIVSAAVGILSGTSLRAIAQTSIKPVHLNTGTQKAKTVKFIEGIEFKPEASSHVNGMRLLEPVNQFFPVVNTSLSALTVSAIESCNQLQFKYALLMDLEVETISDMKLYGFIDDWWATRYRYGGTGRKGIDCSSFTGKLFAEVFHINLPRTAHAQYATCTRLKKDELTAGDLVFFAHEDAAQPGAHRFIIIHDE